MATTDTEVTAAVDSARELLAAWTVAQYLDQRSACTDTQHTHLKSAVCVDPGRNSSPHI